MWTNSSILPSVVLGTVWWSLTYNINEEHVHRDTGATEFSVMSNWEAHGSRRL